MEVAEAIGRGLRRKLHSADIRLHPLADGGDGSLAAIGGVLGGQTYEVAVFNPIRKRVKAGYHFHDNTAYVELAAASGLVLLTDVERSALHTTTLGTGQLMADAIRRGADTIYLFIGGSATNDGGMGIAQALGYRFFDEKNEELPPVGASLASVYRIDASGLLFDPGQLNCKVVCDVTNPFAGPAGAAYVYAPQKGADTAVVERLDAGLRHFALTLTEHGYPDVSELPGAGAAGGVGGGAVALLGGEIIGGFSAIAEMTGLAEQLTGVDLVITGEGMLDGQSIQGKVVDGVATMARSRGIPTVAACGNAETDAAKKIGLDRVWTVMSRSKDLAEAMTTAAEKLDLIGEAIGEYYLAQE